MMRYSWCLALLSTHVAALNAFFGAVAPKSAPKQQLLDLCKDSNYGAVQIDRDRLDGLIDELAAANPTPRPAELETALETGNCSGRPRANYFLPSKRGCSRPGRVLASSKPSTSLMAGSKM